MERKIKADRSDTRRGAKAQINHVVRAVLRVSCLLFTDKMHKALQEMAIMR